MIAIPYSSTRCLRPAVLAAALLLPCNANLAQTASDRLTQEQAEGVLAEVAPRVEALRGLDFEQDVPVEVIDDEQTRLHVLKRMERFEGKDRIETTQQAYWMLGLMPEGTDILETMLSVLEDQAGGFYDPQRKIFYLLDDAPASLASMLIAHELTHALEDQHFDLDKRLEAVIDDDDRLFARSAIHEGSATLLMTLYMVGEAMKGNLDMKDADMFGGMASEGTEEMPQVLLRQLAGPYLLGAGFLADGNLLAGITAGFPKSKVNQVYENGPLSSEQILHPEKFWDSELRDDPVTVEVPGVSEALGRRWKRLDQGVLGELTLGVLVGAETPIGAEALLGNLGDAWSHPAVAGWGGDRWELWGRGQRRVALLLTRWDSPADAREFADAIRDSDGLRARLEGDRVAVVTGDGRAASDRLLASMLGE